MFSGLIEKFAKEMVENLSPELRVMIYDWLVAMGEKAEETETWMDNVFVYFVKRLMGFDENTTLSALREQSNKLRNVLKK